VEDPDRSNKSRSLRELERKAEAMSRLLSMWSLSLEKSERERGEEGFQTSGGRRRETIRRRRRS
jgi:hypothetical protein